jgi:hypothetical protein
MSVGLFAFIGAVVLALLGQQKYDIHQMRKSQLLSTYSPSFNCSKIGEGLLPGPEDFTLSHQHNLLFISSHDRRNMFTAIGSLFVLHTVTGELHQLESNYPANFRPHGIAISENCGSSDVLNIFVISHHFLPNSHHAIEKFSYTISTQQLYHLETLVNELLVSPNDLITLNCDDLLVSNDNFTPNQLLGLLSGAFKIRNSDLLHYEAAAGQWKSLNMKVAFGNGLALHKDHVSNKEYLIRSSSADYSLFTYEITRSGDGKLLSVEGLVSQEILPFSPDNIEEDVQTGYLIITGHPSTELFLRHAIFRSRAPSVAVLYASPGNFTTLYYDDGNQLSAASVATRTKDNQLYVGQVFDPFILQCQ